VAAMTKLPESAVMLSPAGSGHQAPSGGGPACAGKVVEPDDERLWDFDAGENANNRAKVICRTCPVQEWCLAVAVRDKLSGIWGGVSLLNGAPYEVLRLANTSTHRHRANGEPLCDVCVDARVTRLARRREQDRARDRAKKASSA
jgi:hypothetical protein